MINLEKRPLICYHYSPMTIYASVDIGSNTLRLLIARFDGSLQPLAVKREITRLGEGLERTGRINPEAMRRSLLCLKDYAREMQANGVSAYRAVATAAARRAANTSELIDRALDETGISIEVIPAEEEARLTLAGVLGAVDAGGKTSLVFDIGGGSTEFIVCRDTLFGEARSLDLGVVGLTERFFKKEDPPDDLSWSSLKRFIRAGLNPLVSEIREKAGTVDMIIGTAGTVTTLAAMLQKLRVYDPRRINNYCMERERLKELYESMIKLTVEARSRLAGLEPGRADIIPAGALMVLEIMDCFRVDEVTVSDAGLLEGIIYGLLPSGRDEQENQ